MRLEHRRLFGLENEFYKVGLESSNNAQKVESMDCHAANAARNDKKHTQNLESTFEKAQMDCHAIATALARNDKNNTTSKKVDSSKNAQSLNNSQAAVKSSKTQTRILGQNDSKICGGAVVALRLLGKVSDLGDRAFHKRRNTAALLAQS